MSGFESWGRYPKAEHEAERLYWRSEAPDLGAGEKSVLAYGQGRSYGDCCLNDGGRLLATAGLDHFMELDREDGLLCCEAGVTLAEALEVITPHGWFLPTTPGTRFVSIGGAIANDVHGKNHHRAGTFGNHVTRFELLRSDGQRLLCSPTENQELFAATIGGLGLTGLILWAEIRLARVESVYIDEEVIRFNHVDEFFDLIAESDAAFEHTVAWIDTTAGEQELGRGLFMRGNFARADQLTKPPRRPGLKLRVPVDAPNFLLNALSIRAFNSVYARKQRRAKVNHIVHYEPFFYPLDAILEWNRIYGKRGFLQYQFVVPHDGGKETISEVLRRVGKAQTGSFLTVLKSFGDIPSPGMMSFPRPGLTLAMDFPNQGETLLRFLDELDALVRERGGAVYPAKDARMSAASFDTFYPQWRDFARHIDPRFSSSLWRRVTGEV